MNVLSLFDGMGCAWIALKELGIKVDKGYSSEIDRHAAHQVEVNFPEVERLGSVTEVDVSKLERIDLLLGGSPCQSFSFAGKRKGMATTENEEIYTLERYLELKRQGFLFEGQSYLFWEYMRILEDIRKYNPDVLFLLENVEMGKKWERVLSEAIGIRGVHINSALVSAQNRKRIYWTNIRVRQEGLFGEKYSDIPQPKDRGILLKDVLEEEVDGKYFLSEDTVRELTKHLQRNRENGNGFGISPRTGDEKINALRVGGKGMYDLVCIAMRGRETACLTTKRNEYGKAIRKDYEAGRVNEQRKNIQRLEPRMDGKTNALTTVAKDNLVLDGGDLFCVSSNQTHATVSVNKSTPLVAAMGMGGGHVPMVGECKPQSERKIIQLNPAKEYGNSPQQQNCIYDVAGISPSLTVENTYRTKILNKSRIRRLTPTECARLQTIPGWYKWDVSETQQYKMLGNGWTVEVIKHILSFIGNNGEESCKD